MTSLPALFVSHGAPNLILSNSPARDFLSGLAAILPRRPKAIIMVSAHWETLQPTVSAPVLNETIYDFGGFERELYMLRYAAASDPEIAQHAVALLQSAGMAVTIDVNRGLDHGAWVPLMLSWPQADIPVIQLSVQSHASVEHHLALGAAIEPLRHENCLIMGSGSFTHDLRSYIPHRHDRAAAEPDWVSSFANWMDAAISTHDLTALLNYRMEAPEAVRNHPTEEHLLPLFVAIGAGGNGPARTLHRSTTYGVMRMDAYAFGDL